jgi:nitronate monooxygenase
MAGVSTPELAAEISNRRVWFFGTRGKYARNGLKAEILKTQALTDKPFQVNFFCHQPERLDQQKAQQWIEYIRPQFAKFGAEPPSKLRCIYPSFLDNDNFLNAVLETQPKAVSFHFGIPHPRQIQALKDAGIVTLVSATNLLGHSD